MAGELGEMMQYAVQDIADRGLADNIAKSVAIPYGVEVTLFDGQFSGTQEVFVGDMYYDDK